VANPSSATDSNPKPDKPKLWAGISTAQPIYTQQEVAKRLVRIQFSVVNDGRQPVRPRLGESNLIINGEVLKEWEFIVGNGPCRANASNLRDFRGSLRFGTPSRHPCGLVPALGKLRSPQQGPE
jgi:hypothetical protein